MAVWIFAERDPGSSSIPRGTHTGYLATACHRITGKPGCLSVIPLDGLENYRVV